MKRRFIAAAVLIGILLAGVFTTVITSNFVSSQAEKVATGSLRSENAADTPENIVLSRNETNIGVSSSLAQMPLYETDEESDISGADTDELAESENEPEESVSASESEVPTSETSVSETEGASPVPEAEDRAEVSPLDNLISPHGPDGFSIVEDTEIEYFRDNLIDDMVISEIGSSGPGDYVSITPLDTAAADAESEDALSSDPGEGNVTTVGETAEPSETVKSPLEGAASQPDDSASVTSADLLARLTSVEEKTSSSNSSESPSPQAAEYELNLWNYEMNYIADTLRSAMDSDDAESLLQEQLKFLKDRDLAYDSGAMASRAQAETDTSYIVEATEKTRDRCYYLLDTYGDILD